MPDENYSVKINRRDGLVEITGTDKDWIATQLDKLSVVYTADVAEPDDGDTGDTGEGQGATSTRRRRAPRRSSTSTGARRGSSSSADDVKALKEKLTDAKQTELKKYIDAREAKGHFKSKQDQAAIIASYLEDKLGYTDGINGFELAAVYDVMGRSEPGNPRAVINNARDRNKYFQGWSGGRTKLSAAGRNFGRHESLKGGES